MFCSLKSKKITPHSILKSTALICCIRPSSAAFEPEWLAAVAEGKERLVSIDCSTAEECDREGVKSLPLVVLFESGNVVAQYKGPRRASPYACISDQPVVHQWLANGVVVDSSTLSAGEGDQMSHGLVPRKD